MQQMKKAFTFFLVFICLSSYGQDQRLLDNTWYFSSGELNGEPVTLPFPNFQNELNFDSTGMMISYPQCEHVDGGSIIYGITNDTFDLDGGPFSLLGTCSFEFMIKHLFIYYDENDFPKNPFNYTFEDEGSNLVLTITNGDGDFAVYNNTFLSNPNFEHFSYHIHPNPVRDELFITSNTDLNLIGIFIHDVYGRLVKVLNDFDNKSIYLQDLNNGLYFIRLNDNSGRTAIRMFVKN